MALFKFNDFTFDSESYQLEQKGARLALRPKALKLLSLLIENRHRVVSKGEIYTSVWGQAYARDHLLFQLVSELRKAPFETSFVRTQPNEGYRWIASTKVVPPARSFGFFQLGSALALGLMLVATSYFLLGQDEPKNITAQLPANSAFAKGVVAMEAGKGEMAVEWFRFALRENPESIESSLFLAESLLQQNKVEESSQKLYSLLAKPNLGAYNTMTATDMLSRIHQRQGSLRTALRYAQQSQRGDVLAQCSVDVISERVDELAGQLGLPLVPEQVRQSGIAIDGEKRLVESAQHTVQCSQLKDNVDETTFCFPGFEGELYADQRNIKVIGLV